MEDTLEDLDKIPAIQSLNRFAQELPPEHRSKLYETVGGFLSIGAMHGAFCGAAGAIGTTSKGNKQDLYTEYLSKKALESKI